MRETLATIDLELYPLGEPGGGALAAVVDRIRADLASSGCSVLPGFLSGTARALLGAQGTAIADRAYYDTEVVNVYNTAPDESLPAGHPARHTMLRGNAFVARDRIPADFVIAQLYADLAFAGFLARCFGLARVHPLGDPLSGLCLNVLEPGREHPWHFDTNEFTVSMLTQEPEGGGVFEFCPGIRSPQAENLDAVCGVLTGRRPDLVRRLTLRPGDLQLFLGRYSLHRVSAVCGATPRHSAILAYSERPGVVGTVARTRQLFGRVTPDHLTAGAGAVRVDELMD